MSLEYWKIFDTFAKFMGNFGKIIFVTGFEKSPKVQ